MYLEKKIRSEINPMSHVVPVDISLLPRLGKKYLGRYLDGMGCLSEDLCQGQTKKPRLDT